MKTFDYTQTSVKLKRREITSGIYLSWIWRNIDRRLLRGFGLALDLSAIKDFSLAGGIHRAPSFGILPLLVPSLAWCRSLRIQRLVANLRRDMVPIWHCSRGNWIAHFSKVTQKDLIQTAPLRILGWLDIPTKTVGARRIFQIVRQFVMQRSIDHRN
jgi:hypothetical protein